MALSLTMHNNTNATALELQERGIRDQIEASVALMQTATLQRSMGSFEATPFKTWKTEALEFRQLGEEKLGQPKQIAAPAVELPAPTTLGGVPRYHFVGVSGVWI